MKTNKLELRVSCSIAAFFEEFFFALVHIIHKIYLSESADKTLSESSLTGYRFETEKVFF